MPLFTDTELQMKFCEGFSFYPFKSLEQHGTLIYKCYAGNGNLIKALEWNSREHSFSHYKAKITKKIKRQDIPAAAELKQLLQEAADWWETRLPSRNRMPAKEFPEYIDKYLRLVTYYQKNVLEPAAAKLSPKDGSIDSKNIEEMEEMMQQFVQKIDTLHHFLKEHTNKKSSLAPRTLDEEDREYLSKMAGTIDSFRALQERSIYLLDAWKTLMVLHNNRRDMN